MSSKECEEQLSNLIEHFNYGGLDFNATDIKAIEHLLLENQMQHTEIQRLKNCLKQANAVKEEEKRRKELIQKKRNKYKARLNKLQQKINRAIEYVEPLLTDREDKFYPICSYNKMVLLEILKGDNNE